MDDTFSMVPKPHRLSETRLCEIAGVKRSRRHAWADRGILRLAPRRQGYGELDAAELAAFLELVGALDFNDAVLAWQGIRPAIKEGLFANQLVAVVDLERKRGTLVTDVERIGDEVLSGRPFCAVDLTDRVAGVRDTFRRDRDLSRPERKASSRPRRTSAS